MKKIICLILLLTLAFGLISCQNNNSGNNNDSNDNNTNDGNNPVAESTYYDKLNEFSRLRYEQVNLMINLSGNGAVLNSYYELTDEEIVYSVERLNLFPTDGDFSNISPEYKMTYSGTAKVANGSILEMDGEEVILPTYDELRGSFNFKEEYFANAVNENGKFTADVVSASGFLGRDVAVQNMRCSVEYNETSFVKIVLNYIDGGVQVTSIYEFTK